MSGFSSTLGQEPLPASPAPAVLMYGLALLVTALVMAWSLMERRQQLLDAETLQTAAAAEMARSWAQASFNQTGMVLSGARLLTAQAMAEESPAALDTLGPRLARHTELNRQVSRLVLLDPGHNLLATSDQEGTERLLADARDELDAFRARPGLVRRLSGVLPGGDDLPPRAVNLHRLQTPSGLPLATLVAELDLSVFHRALAREAFPLGGSLAILDDELNLVGRYPRLEAGPGLGIQVSADRLTAALDAGDHLDGLVFRSPLDGAERLFSARRLAGVPYLVVAGREMRQVFAPWWQQASMLAAGWLFLALVGLLALRRHLSLLATKHRLRDEAALRARAQRRLEESAAELQIAAMAFDTHLGMFITDADGRVLRTNATFSHITGFSAAEVEGRKPSMWASGRHDSTFYREMWQTLTREGSWQGEVWNRRKSGEVYPQWLTISAIRNGEGRVTHYVATLTDLSESKAAESAIQRLAFYDPLTGLPNRRLLIDRLGEVIKQIHERDHFATLLLVGLDNFKAYNNTLGHASGDALLRRLAESMRRCLRESDTLARWGGDQFALLVHDLGNAAPHAARSAERLAEQLLREVPRVASGGEESLPLTASIGISLFHNHQLDAPDAIRQAELAMYEAKQAGGSSLRFFDQAMQVTVTERAHLEADLDRALELEELSLYYQPQVNEQGTIVGLEALLRWEHPHRGMVSPGVFIPLAEESGRILPIGRWVLERACHQLATWTKDPGRRGLTISVNVSPVQFHQADFVASVEEILAATGADPQRLVLEVTESLFLRDPVAAQVTMEALRARGVRFALDDFGTGYSSLGYLKRLPLHELKIDQSFVRDLHDSPADAAIVETIIALADRLSLSVTAEGVETEAQAHWLREHGCGRFQGYLYARPAPLVLLFPEGESDLQSGT